MKAPILKSLAVPALLFAGALLFFGTFTLSSPYHLDTVIYLESVEQLLETGEAEHPFRNRFLNAYLYLLPVALRGEAGVKWITVITAGLFLAAYCLLVRRNFAGPLAIPSALLMATAPATVLTVTHLKEDLNALLLFTLAVIVLGRRPTAARAFAAGMFYGLALLCKEFPLFLGPFLLAYLYLRRHDPGSWRELLDPRGGLAALPAAAALFAGSAAVLLLLMPDYFAVLGGMTESPYNGQFLGPFSSIQGKGYRLWKEGVLYLHPLSWLAALSILEAFRKRRFMTLLWFFSFGAVFLILSNTTVVRARVFGPALFFLLPLVAQGAFIALERAQKIARRLGTTARKGWEESCRGGGLFRPLSRESFHLPGAALCLAALGVALLQVAYVMPTLRYRLQYHPQKEFYRSLGESLPGDALLLGMDNCRVATYYTGLECLRHPVDPDEERYRRFMEEVRSRRRGRRLFTLPDFLAYDRGEVIKRNLGKDFVVEEAHAGITEDFHRLTYGRDMGSVIGDFLATYRDCRLTGREARAVTLVPGLVLDFAGYAFDCDSEKRRLRFIEYLNHETFLARYSVSELL